MITKRIVCISYFTMLMIVGAVIKLPVPGYAQKYYTLQAVVAISSGLILGAKDGAISQAVYILLGIVGLPIFVGGGGFDFFSNSSFGFIVSFFIGAILSGTIKSRYKTLSVLKLFFSAVCGLIVIYFFGMLYQFFIEWRVNGQSVASAFIELTPYPFLFIIDALLLYGLCIIYPRVMTLIGMSKVSFESGKQKKPAGPAVDNDKEHS